MSRGLFFLIATVILGFLTGASNLYLDQTRNLINAFLGNIFQIPTEDVGYFVVIVAFLIAFLFFGTFTLYYGVRWFMPRVISTLNGRKLQETLNECLGNSDRKSANLSSDGSQYINEIEGLENTVRGFISISTPTFNISGVQYIDQIELRQTINRYNELVATARGILGSALNVENYVVNPEILLQMQNATGHLNTLATRLLGEIGSYKRNIQ